MPGVPDRMFTRQSLAEALIRVDLRDWVNHWHNRAVFARDFERTATAGLRELLATALHDDEIPAGRLYSIYGIKELIDPVAVYGVLRRCVYQLDRLDDDACRSMWFELAGLWFNAAEQIELARIK